MSTNITLEPGTVITLEQVSETPLITTPGDADLLPIVQDGVTKHLAYSDLRNPILQIASGALGSAIPTTDPTLVTGYDATKYQTFNIGNDSSNATTFTHFLDSTSTAIVISTADLAAGKITIEGIGNVWKKNIVPVSLTGVITDSNIQNDFTGGTAGSKVLDAALGTQIALNGGSTKTIKDLDDEKVSEAEITGKLPVFVPITDVYVFEDASGKVVFKIRSDGTYPLRINDADTDKVNYWKLQSITGWINIITDNEGKLLWGVRTDGTVYPDNSVIKIESVPGFIYAVLDSNDALIWGIKTDGSVYPQNNSTNTEQVLSTLLSEEYPLDINQSLIIDSFTLIKSNVNIPIIAIGRESAAGAGDAPMVSLDNNPGCTHPSVVYLPAGWNGFKYWMAITPTFGVIETKPDPTSYENPHILCSHDGIIWQTPLGLTTPLDLPEANTTDYWSDTHLKIGDDGMMYCFYRGNGAIIGHDNPQVRICVCRASRDGINWSGRTVLWATDSWGSDLTINSAIVSQAYIKNGSYWHCYDGFFNGAGASLQMQNTAASGNNQTSMFVVRRTTGQSPLIGWPEYAQEQCVNFINRPWGTSNDVWHLDAQRYGNGWFLLLAVGPVGIATAESLWLAYSGDGWNFNVIETPLIQSGTYRSCLVAQSTSENSIKFLIYQSDKTNGEINLYSLTLKNQS